MAFASVPAAMFLSLLPSVTVCDHQDMQVTLSSCALILATVFSTVESKLATKVTDYSTEQKKFPRGRSLRATPRLLLAAFRQTSMGIWIKKQKDLASAQPGQRRSTNKHCELGTIVHPFNANTVGGTGRPISVSLRLGMLAKHDGNLGLRHPDALLGQLGALLFRTFPGKTISIHPG